MAKTRSAFFCKNCGYESPKWLGKCPSCNTWNSFVEEVIKQTSDYRKDWKSLAKKSDKDFKPVRLHEIKSGSIRRIPIIDQEFSRVLGGGLVPGSLVLVGGEPGIGKSTLMLQIASSLIKMKVLYVSGEESEQQIKMRAERMKNNTDGEYVETEHLYVFTETSTDNLFREIENLLPDILVVDSIQTLHSNQLDATPGSISQVRQCAGEIMKYAKETGTPAFLIGHITKDGTLAGPKILEHMVDTVLQFEGDRHNVYRILRTTKNRFGSTSELGIYEMRGTGLKQVSNPSEILISHKDEPLSGVAIGASLEGNRPLLIELQSLVSTANYGTPQRSSTGFDLKRLNMLLAVLEKRGGFRLGIQDVFLNVAGGIKVEDPALDLAVCISLVSSYEEIPVPDRLCFAAEVGLGGEVRAVNRIESRISEAEKLGFDCVYISKYNLKSLDKDQFKIKVKPFSKLRDVFSDVFG